MNLRRTLSVAALLFPGVACAHPPYEVIDLGDFVGDIGSAGAFGINGRGEPVGGADDENGRQAFVYTGGKLVRLPTPGAPSAVFSEGFFINNSGVVAGNFYTNALASRAVIWDENGYHDLGTFGGSESVVLGMNSRTEVIGLASTVETLVPFIWLPKPAYGRPAGMSQISSFYPTDINSLGHISGNIVATNVPTIWLPEPALGRPAGLNELPAPIFPGGVLPQAMNERSAMVGYGLADEGTRRPALWLPADMYALDAGWHDLGLFGRDRTSFCWDINERGWIAGTRMWVGDPPNEFEDPPVFIQGWLWIPGQGRVDLDDLLPETSGYAIVYPRSINNRGQIAASAVSLSHGSYRAVLLSPVCVPDWDADGTLNSADFFGFLTDFFDGFADFDANGVNDSQDFFAFLEAFFTGC